METREVKRIFTILQVSHDTKRKELVRITHIGKEPLTKNRKEKFLRMAFRKLSGHDCCQ